ncbi:hypothetical protein ACN47E_004535 [Coniothyrium glycines]
MPAKIVYGKKRVAAKAQTSFTKFLSPDKRDVPPKRTHETSDIVEDDEWRQDVDLVTKKKEPTKNAEGDGILALGKALESLHIEKSKPRAEENQGVDHWKDDDKQVVTKPKKNKRRVEPVQAEAELALSLQALAMSDEEQEAPHDRGTRSRPRKALEARDVNATKIADVEVGGESEKQGLGSRRMKVEVRIPARSQSTIIKAKPASKATQQDQQLPTPEATPEPENVYNKYASPLLTLSDRKRILSFEDWSAELEPHFEISKIAEASFSEVYRLSALYSTSGLKQESVLKVVALKTPPDIPLPCQTQTRAARDREGQLTKELADRDERDQWKSHIADVLSEVKLLQNLNHIPGFTVFRDLTIVQGRPSVAMNEAWKSWNKARPRGKKSEFPDPSKKSSYDELQLWAVVEMQDAGTDCEKVMELGGFTSVWEIWDIFWGVCMSIAKAEEACNFEHRDLHLGNICVRSSTSQGDVLQVQVQEPIKRKLHFTGLETTVIDYTLSRADIIASSSRRSSHISHMSNSTSASNSGLEESDVAYLDLNKDPALFEGDASEEYQYQIYRYMRGAALFNNPLQSAPLLQDVPSTPARSSKQNTHIHFDDNEGEVPATPRRSPRKHASTPAVTAQPREEKDVWRSFHPKTNLVWAHFLLHKLMNHLAYQGMVPSSLSEKQIMESIAPGAEELDCAKVKKKATKLYKVLQRVSELLCPVALGREEGLSSMKELVVLALEERWLRVSDVEG